MPNHKTESNIDRTRLTLLWTEAQPLVLAYIRSAVRDPADAEDLLQQVAYDVSMNFEQYDSERSFPAWAIGIAKFKMLAYRSSKSRERLVFNDEALSHIADAYARQPKEFSEDAKALEFCMRKLTPKARGLIELRYIQNCLPDSIAKRLGTSNSTVSVALTRIRNRLRQCIERHRRREGHQ